MKATHRLLLPLLAAVSVALILTPIWPLRVSSCKAFNEDNSASLFLLSQASIEAEMRTRADRYLAQKQLVVDYYRIGRRLAFPLVFERIPQPALPVLGIPDYPWEIWLAWEIEERLNCLGWAAQWFNNRSAAAEAGRELGAITQWPAFTSAGRIDLCLGHTSRTLCQAYGQWRWLDPSTKDSIGKALDRLVLQATPWVEATKIWLLL